MHTHDTSETVNILLVDDDPYILRFLSLELQSTDYLLVTVESGERALEELDARPFAVCITDVMMAGIDGFELARQIRSNPKIEDTPIIFLSAVATADKDIFHGYSLGAFDYLAKPVNPELLRAKVAVFVNLYRKTEAIKRQYSQLPPESEPTRPHDEQLDKNYLSLLLAHVRATRKGSQRPTTDLIEMAAEMALRQFDANQLVRLHLNVVQEVTHELVPTSVQPFVLDAQLLLLELMGRSLDRYRTLSISKDSRVRA